MSSVGKGVVASSICFLLKKHGLKVTPVKCENYFNVDAGTINPIEHGDPFLCEDGLEADMDLGNYERFLNQEMERENFITMGQIMKRVIEKERSMGYDGEDVEAIPHVCNEIIRRIKEAGEKSNADVATEFVNMIQAQNGFQANARSIRVANDILRELTSLIR